MWGIESYLRSLAMAQETHLRQSYWALGAILDGIAPGLAPRALESIRYFVAGQSRSSAGARCARSTA